MHEMPSILAFAVAASLAVLVAVATAETPADVPAAESVRGPYLRVLGTAQDGGFPHAACDHDLCRRARESPALRRYVSSLGLVLPGAADAADRVYLIDATPDLRAQLDLLRDVRRPPTDRVDRAPVDGVFLTHAHLGHYLGLAFFGFEAVHTRELPVWTTPRMAGYLRDNGPWSQLVAFGNIALKPHAPGSRVDLGGVTVESLAVPHRDELSDTVAYLVHGPNRTVLYVPDTDAWDAWSPSLEAVLDREQVDIALLDATFYSLAELPGRDLSSVPHPLITQSMDRLAGRVEAGKLEVYFTHLNHSNPAIDPESEAARAVRARGFAVLADGQEIGL